MRLIVSKPRQTSRISWSCCWPSAKSLALFFRSFYRFFLAYGGQLQLWPNPIRLPSASGLFLILIVQHCRDFRYALCSSQRSWALDFLGCSNTSLSLHGKFVFVDKSNLLVKDDPSLRYFPFGLLSNSMTKYPLPLICGKSCDLRAA